MTISSRRTVVCGLAAEQVTISSRKAPQQYELGSYTPVWPPETLLPHEVEFEFWLRTEEDMRIARQRFPVGDRAPFMGHDLGPADVCPFCGTAWLPGTIKCPACAGDTTHQDRAIEYATRQGGIVVMTRIEAPVTGFCRFFVQAEFRELTWTPGGIGEMFRHSPKPNLGSVHGWAV